MLEPTTPKRRRFKMPARIVVNVSFAPCEPGTNPWRPFLDRCVATMARKGGAA